LFSGHLLILLFLLLSTKSHYSDKQEEELVMSIATMHYLRALRNASVSGKIGSFKIPTKQELIVTVPTHVGTGDVEHPASEYHITVQADGANKTLITFLDSGKSLSVTHNWAVDSPVFRYKSYLYGFFCCVVVVNHSLTSEVKLTEMKSLFSCSLLPFR